MTIIRDPAKGRGARRHALRPTRPLLAMLAVLLLAACAPGTKTPGWTFAPTEPPRPAQEKVIPSPPEELGDNYVWELGYWHWDGKEYTWVPGHFVEQPYRGSNWVDGVWIYTGTNHWIWIPGHWRKQ